MDKPSPQGALSKRGYKINAKYANRGNVPKLTSRNAYIHLPHHFMTGKKLALLELYIDRMLLPESRSLADTTPITPGALRASSKFMDVIFPWGMVLRTRTATSSSHLGLMSFVNIADPLAISRDHM